MAITRRVSPRLLPGLPAAAEYAGPAGPARVPLHRGDGRRGETGRAGREGNHRLPVPEHRTSGRTATLCQLDVASCLMLPHVVCCGYVKLLKPVLFNLQYGFFDVCVFLLW